MPDTVISVEALSKRYWLGHMPRHDTLRDALSHTFKSLPRLLRQSVTRSGPTNRDELWALRDVTFEVKRGEVVGIIGRNGAGKSTLLKILSRITEPTTGRVTLQGRVASLLEVGTGFHPELTGRENVFLNGAILGMSRAEIHQKFDEIVAFAEVEKFLDTPVKHYSSGMYVRLAFAVAAHLEPEILIVDEVLAVGDFAFQQKCLGKMEEVARGGGRTILFVSHQLTSLAQICPRCLLLTNGHVTVDAPSGDVIARYLSAGRDFPEQVLLADLPRNTIYRQHARLVQARSLAPASAQPWGFPFGDPIRFRIAVECARRFERLEVAMMLVNSWGVEVLSTMSNWSDNPGPFPLGRSEIEITLPELALAPGNYLVHFGLRGDRDTEDFLSNALRLTVLEVATADRREAEKLSGCFLPTARFSRVAGP